MGEVPEILVTMTRLSNTPLSGCYLELQPFEPNDQVVRGGCQGA